MANKPEIKITRTYSLDPVVVAWVTQKAARITLEGDGERASDSQVVNDLLLTAMKENVRSEKSKRKFLKRVHQAKVAAA